jgi:hypothetical protein
MHGATMKSTKYIDSYVFIFGHIRKIALKKSEY